MAFVQYKIYAYCYNNDTSTYSWVELVDGNGRSRLVSFDDISVSASSPLKNFASYADLNSIVVSDHDNFWGNIPDASNGLINTSDPKWKDWYHRPLKLAICDENGTAVKSIVVLLDDIAIKEGEVKATLSVIGLARAAMEAKADGKTIGGNTIYGAWTGDTTPTLYAAYTEDLDFNFTERTWFRNRRIKDILKKQVYALNHNVFGTPSIEDIHLDSGDRWCCSPRSDLSNGISETPYAMASVNGASGHVLYIAAGNKLYKYSIATDTYSLVLTETTDTYLFKMWFNTYNECLYIVKYDVKGATEDYTLIEYDTIGDRKNYERDLTDIANPTNPDPSYWWAVQVLFVQPLDSNQGAFFYITESGGTYGYAMYTCHDLESDWTLMIAHDLPSTDASYQYKPGYGLCLDDDYYYVPVVDKYIFINLYGSFTPGNPADLTSHILKINLTNETWTLVFKGTLEATYYKVPTIREIAVLDGDEVFASCWAYTPGASYIGYIHDDGTPGAFDKHLDKIIDITSYPRSRMGFIKSDMMGSVDRIFYIRNRDNTAAVVYMDGSKPIIEEINKPSDDATFGLPLFSDNNWGCSTADDRGFVMPVLASNNDTIYGIAFPNHTLFQISTEHSGFLSLLKWDGMSCADICDALAQHQNAIWYYDDDGVFHFEQITDNGLSSVKDFAEAEVLEVELTGAGRDAIKNCYNFVPYNIIKKAPETEDPTIEQGASSDMHMEKPIILPSCDEVAHWRVVITNAGTGAYSLQKFIEGTDYWSWVEQATGSVGTALVEDYISIPAGTISGTYTLGDMAYFYVLPVAWDFEPMNELNRTIVRDDTSIATYQRQEEDVEGKFTPRVFAIEMLQARLSISKNPHRKLTARLPFEGNESVLKTGNIITITCAKLGLTSSNKLKITRLAWSGDNCRIAVAAELLQMT